MPRNRKEEVIQTHIVSRFWNLKAYKQLKLNAVLYSNRNENNKGGKQGLIFGSIYKAMGRLAGVPDLTLLYDGKIAFIEVKTPEKHKKKDGSERATKGMEDVQIAFYDDYIKPMNIPFVVCSSVNDFENFLSNLGILK